MFNRTKKTAAGAAGVFALITAITMTGCSAKLPFSSNRLDFDRSYVVSAEITCDKLEAKADITRVSGNEWEFAFTEPKELSGITLCLGEKGYTASLGGLSFKADDNAVYTMLPEIISGAVNSLSAVSSENITAKDGIITMDLEADGKKVTVTANEKTGELITLKCPYHKLSVAFSGQKAYVPPEPELPDEGGLIKRDTQSNSE